MSTHQCHCGGTGWDVCEIDPLHSAILPRMRDYLAVDSTRLLGFVASLRTEYIRSLLAQQPNHARVSELPTYFASAAVAPKGEFDVAILA
jgi:hypothetical protein